MWYDTQEGATALHCDTAAALEEVCALCAHLVKSMYSGVTNPD